MAEIVVAIVAPVVESLMVPIKKHLSYLISCRKYVKEMHTIMEKLKDTRLDVEHHMNYNKSMSLEVPKEIEAWLREVGMIDEKVKTIPIDVGSCFNLNVRYKRGRVAIEIIHDIDHLMEKESSINWTNNPIRLAEVFRSYKDLHDEETRLTLSLCVLFPEDFDTPTEDLVRYIFGLKLFKNVDTIRETRIKLNICITELMQANLLIQSEQVGCVKMEDLVRAFVLDVCSESGHSSVVDNISKWIAMREYCTNLSMHEFPRNLLLLKLMFEDESSRFPEDFFEGMSKLEVIAYEKMEYPSHLRSLECFASLRTLCLHHCSLMFDCSFIGNLLNLEVLSLAYSSIHKLPYTIVRLYKLKLLDLTNCRFLCIDGGILRSLVKLEELYMRGTRRKVKAEGDELVWCLRNLGALEIEFFDKDVVPHNMSYLNLERFRISLGCHLDKIDVQNRYSFENTLMLANNACELWDLRILLQKTKVLYLHMDGTNDLGDGLMGCIHNLRVLHICECTNLKYLFTIPVANGLKHLERLKIDQCSVLETLVDGYQIDEVEVITFQALKFLSLKGLPRLMSLCTGGSVIQLPQLEELELDSLPNFTSIYQHFLKEEVMAKLKKLDIYRMENLKEIWPSELSNNDEVMISNQVREIRVEGCDSLVNLFPRTSSMSLVRHLERLLILDCNSIEVIFNIDLRSSSSSYVGEIEEEGSSNNLRSIKVNRCRKLKTVWRVVGLNNWNIDDYDYDYDCDYDHLHITHFQNVECIEITECESLRNVFTPITLKFDMRSLTKIILDGQMEEINVVTFLPCLLHTCRYLRSLDIIGFTRVKVVFEIESPNSRILTTTPNNQQPPLLPHLKDLYLFGMERMTHVWSPFLFSQQERRIFSSFLNLSSIVLDTCNSIKFLFSPLMAKLLSNLTSITIYKCDAIEEVVSNIEDEYEEIVTSVSSHTNTTFFQHLDTLDLSGLRSLNRIGSGLTSVIATHVHDQFQNSQSGVTCSSFCKYLKKIHIRKCNALLNLIPSHEVGKMPKLEELVILDCMSMMEIFGNEGVNKDVVDIYTNIGSAMTINSLELPNLKVLHIQRCHGLEYIFTSSTFKSLKNLEELEIIDCSAIQVIVKLEDNGGLEDVIFPCLKSLTLARLPNLKGFFLGKNDFGWPLLDKVEIYSCPQMMIFTHGRSMTPRLKYINTGFGKHSLECGLNFNWTNAPHENQLYNLITSSSIVTDITKLFQFPWSFSNLIELDVGMFHELCWEKTIFPSNELVCTASKLSKLTKVSLEHCPNLEHVFSYGMADSLLQLKELHISYCKNLKVIVQDSDKELVCFPCLKSLQLKNLMSLKGFCLGSHETDFEWPSLHTLKIIECPEMTVFTKGQSTTPKLRVIGTSFGLCEVTEDLNVFIREKLQGDYKIQEKD